VERAARDAANGDPVGNLAALRNPACLDAIAAAVAVGERVPPAAQPSTVAPAGDEGAERDGVDEQALRDTTRLWCAVLGLERAEPDDDFSDVGGTSRRLMSLLRRVSLELGADVPLERFLAEPTPRGIARAVTRARSAGTQEVRVLREGIGRPLFLLSDVWGQFAMYGGLLEHLQTERPLYGLLVPLADEAGRRKRIPELTVETLSRLRAAQPEGPYSLIGYSFGGLVAYEVAAALEAAGQSVAYLGMLDVMAPAAALTRFERGGRRAAKVLEAIASGYLIRAVRRRLPWLPGGKAANSTWALFKASGRVASGHRPSPYGGAVTYYLAKERLPVVGSSLAAWRRSAPHLMVTDVPGRHEGRGPRHPGLLAAEHAETLAARVSATLR
jgi:acetoacetyl-CoA synthetase